MVLGTKKKAALKLAEARDAVGITKHDEIRQAIQRAADRTPGSPSPFEEDVYAIYLMTKGAEALEIGNRTKKELVERRRARIETLWPLAIKAHPANLSKRYDWIIDQLKKESFAKSKKSGVTIETLVNRDLPRLRKQGRLIPPR